MEIRPIKQVFLELEQEVKALATTDQPREHIQRALALVAETRVSLNDIEYHVKSLHHSLLTYDHFQIDSQEP